MVSVIVPTLNSGSYLPELLNRLVNQTARPEEIIIVDSSSDDNTVTVAKSFRAKTIVINRKAFDHGGTRNLAVDGAAGDIVVFLTQDALPVNEYAVANLIKPFYKNEKIAAVSGRQIPHTDATAFAAHLRFFNYSKASYVVSVEDKERGIRTPFLSNSFAAYRRKALEEIGWFREKMIMGEDTYAGARLLLAGYKIAYVADAMVYHSHDYKVWQEFKRYFDIGVFHKTERWITQEFGNAEGEGMKYILSGLWFLANKQKIHLVPEFVLRAFMKYLGYKMGCHYEKLPKSVVPALSMHRDWWHR
jgi:rhamnosyltransferase